MHVIRNLATSGDFDVRSDEASAQAAGDQVAILHAGSPGGANAARPADKEFLLAFRNFDGRIRFDQFDLHAIRRDQFARRSFRQRGEVA